jgi:hypothetical protein
MKGWIVFAGWSLLLAIPFEIRAYLYKNEISNRWGTYSGSTARDILIGEIVLTIAFGAYSIIETIKFLKGKYKK